MEILIWFFFFGFIKLFYTTFLDAFLWLFNKFGNFSLQSACYKNVSSAITLIISFNKCAIRLTYMDVLLNSQLITEKGELFYAENFSCVVNNNHENTIFFSIFLHCCFVVLFNGFMSVIILHRCILTLTLWHFVTCYNSKKK